MAVSEFVDILTMLQTSVTVNDSASSVLNFLSVLDPEQRSRAVFSFESPERKNWSYVPRVRRGLSFGDLSEPGQLEAAYLLIASNLSEQGFKKAKSIIRHELVLSTSERRVGVYRSDRNPELASSPEGGYS